MRAAVVGLLLLLLAPSAWGQGYPPAAQPLGQIPDVALLSQGAGCPTSTLPCQTVASPTLRFGQPIQANCLALLSPFPYQQCIDTLSSPAILRQFIGASWYPVATLDPSSGYIPISGGGGGGFVVGPGASTPGEPAIWGNAGGTLLNDGLNAAITHRGGLALTNLGSGAQVSCLGLTSGSAVVPSSGACITAAADSLQALVTSAGSLRTTFGLGTVTYNSSATIVAANGIGQPAFYGESHSAQSAPNTDLITNFSVVFADNPSLFLQVWAGYDECDFVSAAYGSVCTGREISVYSEHAPVVLDPNTVTNEAGGATIALRLDGGIGHGSPQGISALATLINNGAAAESGIIFGKTALDATRGSGGNGIALDLSSGQEFRWLTAGGAVSGELWSSATSFGISAPGIPIDINSSLVQMSNLTGPAQVTVNEGLGGNQAVINFTSNFSLLWQLGKGSDNSFFAYDFATTRAFLTVSGGLVTLGESGGSGVSLIGNVTTSNLTVTGPFTATGLVTLADLATQAPNTILGNATGLSASPTALAAPSCSTSTSALQWTTNSGFGCNTSINATMLGGATFGAPGPIGGGTASTAHFTTLTASTYVGLPIGSASVFGVYEVDNSTIRATAGVLSVIGSSATVITAGTTTVGGTCSTNNLLYDSGGTLTCLATANNGVLSTGAGGAPAISTTLPSGLAASNMALTSPTASALTVTGSFTATGLVGNTDLVNPSTTVNGQTCTLGSTCTVTATATSMTVGTTLVASGTNGYALYNNSGTLGNFALGTGVMTLLGGTASGSGGPAGTTSPTFVTPVLGAATGTSLNVSGAVTAGSYVGLPIGSASVFGIFEVDNTTIQATAGVLQVIGSAATVITLGTTTIGGGGVTNQLLFDNAGVLGEITKAASSVLVSNGSSVPAWSTTLPGGLSAGNLTETGWLAITGTALPTQGAGTLGIGGIAALPTLAANGEGDIFLTTAGGLVSIGQGSADDHRVYNKSGSLVLNIPTGTTNLNVAGDVLDQGASPTGTAGSGYVRKTSAVLTTPNIGTASGASLSVTGQLTSTVTTGTAPLVVSSTTNVINLNASSLGGATFAAPGPIGSGTPGTGAFTTLSASSTVSGTGFSAYLASPPAIGGTVAAAGTFTTLIGTGGTHTGITSLGIRDTSAAFDVTLAATSSTTLTAGRTLTLDLKNVAHTLSFGATANTITFPNTASYTLIGSGDTGTVTTAMLASAAVTYAKIQNEGAATLLGNPTGSPAAPSEITLGTGLSFSGSVLNASLGGTNVITSGYFSTTGTTLPAQASGTLGIGGTQVAPTMGATAEGDLFLVVANGLSLIGYGSTNDVSLYNSAGNVVCGVAHNALVFNCGTVNVTGSTAPSNGIALPSANTLGLYANTTEVGVVTSTAFTVQGKFVVAAQANNTALESLTGGNLTGSNTTTLFNYQATTNTTGVETVWQLAVTNTASGAGALLMNLLAGSSGVTSEFSVSMAGNVTAAGAIDAGGLATFGSTTAATGSAGEIASTKIAASGTAPGAGYAKIEWVAGTTSGTCKLIAYAGTSSTPVTILDNTGGGC